MTPSVVVTGAGHGLGAAIASAAATAGWVVGVLDLDRQAAEIVASGIGGEAVALVADTTVEAEVSDALDAFAEATGRAAPDGLVANAGIVRFAPLAELEVHDWRAVVDVNLTGTFLTARAVARRMIDAGHGGSIVTITSMNGVSPGPNAGAYGATKAAVALLTKQMAIEWGPHQIRANSVAPGLIDAGMSEPIYADPDIRAQRAGRVPLGRLGTAEDVSNAVLYLLSDQAAYVTGTELLVDGGVTPSIINTLPRPERGRQRWAGEGLIMATNLLISGGPLHDFVATSAVLVEVLAEVGIDSTVVEEPQAALRLLMSGPTSWDMVTVNALHWRMSAERHAHLRDQWSFSIGEDGVTAIEEHVHTGGGLLACHTAAVCFDGHPRWAACIGATWNWGRSSHPPLGPALVSPTAAALDHPLTAGLGEFETVDEIYGFLDEADDLEPLLTSAHGGTDHPMLWTRSIGRGRVVTDLLGHDAAAMSQPVQREILRRAGEWLTTPSPRSGMAEPAGWSSSAP